MNINKQLVFCLFTISALNPMAPPSIWSHSCNVNTNFWPVELVTSTCLFNLARNVLKII